MTPTTVLAPAAPSAKTPPWDPHPHYGPHEDLLVVDLGGVEVARYLDGSGSPAFDAPRPFLHPVRTRGGVVLSDAVPLDHTWHLGLSLGVQDVDGANLWGGRTYLRGDGYTWRRDHGRIEHVTWTRRRPGTVTHRLDWRGPDGRVLLHEERTLAWTTLAPDAWRLDLDTTLRLPDGAPGPVTLGSPGSNGRERAGYGGMFWRMAPCRDVHVRTPLGAGEEAVHGSRAADGATWLAWSATTAAEGADVTLVTVPGDAATAADPWFVRVDDYPGLGSALAWTEPVRVDPELHRSFRWVVADSRWDDERVARTVEAMTEDGR